MATKISQDSLFLDPNNSALKRLGYGYNQYMANGNIVVRANFDKFEGYIPLWCIEFPKDIINPSNYNTGTNSDFIKWANKNKMFNFLNNGTMNNDFSIKRLFIKFLYDNNYGRGANKASLQRKLKQFKETFVESYLFTPIKIDSKLCYNSSANSTSYSTMVKDVFGLFSSPMHNGSFFFGKHSFFQQNPFKALSMLCIRKEYIPYIYAAILMRRDINWEFFKYFELENIPTFMDASTQTRHQTYKQELVNKGIEIIKVNSFRTFFQNPDRPKLTTKEDILNWESYIKEMLIDGKTDRKIETLDAVIIKVAKEEVKPIFILKENKLETAILKDFEHLEKEENNSVVW